MNAPTTDAGKWLAENDPAMKRKKNAPKGKNAKCAGSKTRRIRRGIAMGVPAGDIVPVKSFVHSVRNSASAECILVPAAQVNVPASVVYLGKQILAARYMCLLTHGAPEYEAAVARHTCGNGHLSCVNPNHIIWGSVGDNFADANRHRNVGGNVQDRIHSIS